MIEQHPQSTSTELMKPGLVTALGVMTLVSGIINILTGLGMTAATVLATLGIGLICAPIIILPTIFGIFEVLYALKILANPPVPVQFSQTIAILEILCIAFGNAIALIVGILALVFYNDATVKTYFDRLNAQPSA
ncbi:MAG: hypothetical protein KatS3mg045_0617 [Bellilinea sp.]|nr:MAG: hypothetical protein KatS3mg045_0617 [Bellilinea sp.]